MDVSVRMTDAAIDCIAWNARFNSAQSKYKGTGAGKDAVSRIGK